MKQPPHPPEIRGFPPKAQEMLLVLTLRLSRARAVLSTIRLVLPGADEPKEQRLDGVARAGDLAEVALELVAGAEEDLETLDVMQARRRL